MRRRFGILAALLVGLAATVPGKTQSSAPAPESAGNADASLGRVIGEVTATDPAAEKITIRSDAGGTITILLQEKTSYLRVPPGERDLKKAVKITPGEIGVGDRVLARGRWAEDQRTIPAVAIIVMTRAELARKGEKESAEWQKRALAGTVSTLNPETHEITVSVRSPEGMRRMIVEPAEHAIFRRYAPDSVRLRDAKSSSFAELKVGDSLRILGERNAEGTRIKPEQIVSGSFRNIAGIINAVDAPAGEIKITDLVTKKPLIVRIHPDSVVRRMPPATASATGNRAPAGGGGAAAAGRAGSGGQPAGEPRPGAPARQPSPADVPTTESGSRPATSGGGTAAAGSAGAEGQPPGEPQQGSTARRPSPAGDVPAADSATGNRAPAGSRGTAAGSVGSDRQPAGEPQQGSPARRPSPADVPASKSGAGATRGGAPGGGGGMNLEQMPALSFAELTRGEAVLVLSTAGADPSRVTAIVLVGGVEPLLSSGPDDQPQIGGVWNFFDISLP